MIKKKKREEKKWDEDRKEDGNRQSLFVADAAVERVIVNSAGDAA